MNDITGSINATIPMITASITGKSHANLAHIHLNSARIFTDLALAIDQHYKNQAPQDVINSYMSYVSSSIICSVAVLEANINQFLIDHHTQLSSIYIKDCLPLFKKYNRLKDNRTILNQLSETSTIMFKYDAVSFLLKTTILSHSKIKEDAEYLIKLRNSLVHFTPEWDNQLDKHKSLEDSRKNRFGDSRFYAGDANFIPYRCLDSSCASWSYDTSSAFLKMFNSSIG